MPLGSREARFALSCRLSLQLLPPLPVPHSSGPCLLHQLHGNPPGHGPTPVPRTQPPQQLPQSPRPQHSTLRHAVETLEVLVDNLRRDFALERKERERQRKEFAHQLEQQREEHHGEPARS